MGIFFTLEDLFTLLRTIYGEARGEPFDGMRAVAHVVLNRVEDGTRDHTIAGACLRPWQFSCWNKGNPNLEKLMTVSISDPVMLSCMHAAIEAIEEHNRGEDLTNGATHYCTKYVDPEWAIGAEPLCEFGNHIFYRVAL